MNQRIVSQNVSSLYLRPDSTKVLTQAIYGDVVEIAEEGDDRTKVTMQDGYQGWIRTSHLSAEFPSGQKALITTPFALLYCKEKGVFKRRGVLVFDSCVSLKGIEGAYTALSDGMHFIETQTLGPLPHHQNFSGERLVERSSHFLGTPYFWGGSSSFGYDCSGFIQKLFLSEGVLLPRNTYQQIDSPLGKEVPREDIQTGDLLFFCADRDPRGHGVTHVGMVYDETRFIHASSKLGLALTDLTDAYYTRIFRKAWRYSG
jgi:hypothetical protein